MSAARVRAVVVRILGQLHRDRRTLALMFVAPIVVLGLLGWLQRSAGGPEYRSVFVNEDTGGFGAEVLEQGAPSGGPHGAGGPYFFIGFSGVVSRATAEHMLRTGDVAFYVVLPADFTRQLAARKLVYETHIDASVQLDMDYIYEHIDRGIIAAEALRIQPRPAFARVADHPTYIHASDRTGQGRLLDPLDHLGPALIAFVVFLLVYLVTTVFFVRERTQGTLERLFASPMRRGELVLGYMLGLGLLAAGQVVVVTAFCLVVLRIHNEGSLVLVVGLTLLVALAAVNSGIFISMFARNEFQAVQFVPVALAPQLFLSGLLFPVDGEPVLLRIVSTLLPLTYAVNGLRDVMLRGRGLEYPPLLGDLAILVLFAALALAGAAVSLRRRVA
ncbi:MAG: ABC transporter permease [Candidatus Dormibacteria bacterium]